MLKRAFLVGCIALLGCPDDTPGGLAEAPPVDVAELDEDDPDAGSDTTGEDVVEVPEDTGPVAVEDAGTTGEPEVAQEDAGPIKEPDIQEPDVPEPDVDPTPDPDPGLPVGETCVEDAECAGGLCLKGADYSVCSASCATYACPEGWVCADWPGGVQVCVPAKVCVDVDEDGFGVGRDCDVVDCDDADKAINPGADELCDGVDNDCDGVIDDGVTNACGTCGDAPAEICNGWDDDCDGVVDEDVKNVCGWCGDVPVEVCNGYDDDCNGVIDDAPECVEAPDCEEGATEPCYPGDPATIGVGACLAGDRACVDGAWADCGGFALPGPEDCNGVDDDCDGETDEALLNSCGVCAAEPLEICDGVDNDCDGQIDEGVISKCGGCAPCGEALVFPNEAGLPDPTIAPAPDGGITLGSGQVEYNFIWVPNSDEGSVSRWNTKTGREEARYWIGESPSRTAIDLSGNAWVGHRGDGTASHIFGNKADCIDRNNDGVIQTSTDLNADGVITYGEMLVTPGGDPLADECVHCQVKVGATNDKLRGVAVDKDNYAWLGTYNSRELFKVDPQTCEVLLKVPTNFEGGPLPMYGLAIDGDGMMWTSTFSSGCVIRVDTALGVVVQRLCPSPGITFYGVAVDGQKRAWWADYGKGIAMYDPAQDLWKHHVAPDKTLNSTTGIVVDLDGMVYVASYSNHVIGRFDPKTEAWSALDTYYNLPFGIKAQTNPRGITIDQEGHLWAICRGSSGLVELTKEGVHLGSYDIVRHDKPDSGTGPYSYSDNTGFQLFNFTATEGQWRYVFDAQAQVEFVSVQWTEFEPEGTSVSAVMRTAADPESLEAAPWSTVEHGPAADLKKASARYLELVFTLKTDDPKTKPVLRDIEVFFETANCTDPATPCPAGQLCDTQLGGCIVVPTECADDGACKADEYCDSAGLCHQGCRTTPDNCPLGLKCEPVAHLCETVIAECALNVECPKGTYCDSLGLCTTGCTVTPDSCPPQFACGADDHQCAPLPPECDADDKCPDDEYCGGSGLCLTGCRLGGGGCEVDEICHEVTHACIPTPAACDPEAEDKTEVCDGIDNDCNGKVDETFAEGSLACDVGDAATGTTICYDGVIACQADASDDPDDPVTLSGNLLNVVLPAGFYLLPADATIEGLFVLQAGVEITGQGDKAPYLRALKAIDLRAIGATLSGVNLRTQGGGTVRLVDTVLDGRFGADNRFEVAYYDTDVTLLSTTVRNMATTFDPDTDVTAEFTVFSATDKYKRWLITTKGVTALKHSTVSGTNTTPRVQSGVLIYGDTAISDCLIDQVKMGAAVNTTKTVALTDNTFAVSDIGVEVQNAAWPTLTGNTFDSVAPGNVMVGVRFWGISQGGGATILDSTFLFEPQDHAYWLDPDVWQIDSPTVIEGTVFQGVTPAGQYWVSGSAGAGEMDVVLLDEAVDYTVRDNTSWSSSTVTLGPALVWGAAFPDWKRELQVGTNGKAIVTGGQYVNVGWSGNGSSDLTITGADFTQDDAAARDLVRTYGVAKIVNTSFESLVKTTGDTRISTGVYATSTANVTVEGCAFKNLRYGVNVRDKAVVSVTDVTLEGCQDAFYMNSVVQVTADKIEVTETDPELLSSAARMPITAGGVMNATDWTVVNGVEDAGMMLDPDAFQTATPTTISGLSVTGGRPLMFEGKSSPGDLAIGPLAGINTLVFAYHAELYQAPATIAPGTILQGEGTADRRLLITGGALTVPDGVTFKDVRLQLQPDASADLTNTVFEYTTNANRDIIYTRGVLTADGLQMTGVDHKQQGVVSDYEGEATLTNCTLSDMEFGVMTRHGAELSIAGSTLKSTDPTAGSKRKGIGIWVETGEIVADDIVFDSLETGAHVRGDQGKCTITNSEFINGKHGIYSRDTTAVTITDSTFVGADLELADRPIWVNIANGGSIVAANLTFDVNTPEWVIRLDPDVFQTSAQSSFTNLKMASGDPAPKVVAGAANGGVLVIPAGEYVAFEHVDFNDGAQVTLKSGAVMRGPTTADRRWMINGAGGTMTVETGVQFIDTRLQVQGGTVATLTDTVFTSTSNRDRDYIWAYGKVQGTKLAFTGFARAQQGVMCEKGSDVTIADSTFDELDFGMRTYNEGSGVVTGSVFTNNRFSLQQRYKSALTAKSNTFMDDDPDQSGLQVYSQTPYGGSTLILEDNHFVLQDGDRPVHVELNIFSPDTTLAFSGSTFEDGNQALGYRLVGSSSYKGAPLQLRLLEPAQTSWSLTSTVRVENGAKLEILDGTVLISSDPGSGRQINARSDAVLNVGAATMSDVQLYYQTGATGTVTGADFTSGNTWYVNMVYTTSEAEPITVSGSTFKRTADNQTHLRGVVAGGSADVSAVVNGCTFEGLECALYTEKGAAISSQGNVFTDVVTLLCAN